MEEKMGEDHNSWQPKGILFFWVVAVIIWCAIFPVCVELSELAELNVSVEGQDDSLR
jgi:hypothetical protein